MSRPSTGMTLGVVLMIIFACLTFAFGLAGMSTLHINMVSRLVAQTRARDVAESAMAIAVARVMAAGKFGTDTSDPTASVVLLDSGSSYTEVDTIAGASFPNPQYPTEGVLTFDCADATTLQIPWSVNNIAKTSSAVGWDGRTIPANGLHVVAMGHSGSERLGLEAVILMPPFPYALAASGTITSNGTLLAESVPSGPHINPYALTPCELAPANVGSNSNGQPAIGLGPATIGGDVDAVGGISVSACTVVKGAVEPNHAPITLPFIYVPGQFSELSEYPNVQSIKTATGPLNGLVQTAGNLTVTGDLTLNQAVLYVNGNLSISGGIKGVGAVFVTGTATVLGCSSLTTDDVCALVAMGDISVQGSSQGSSFFQGIVYSSSSITASNVTVLGNMVANAAPMPSACAPGCSAPKCAPAMGTGNITLTNVSIVSDLSTASVTGSMPTTHVAFGCQVGFGSKTTCFSIWAGSQGVMCGGFGFGSSTIGGNPYPLGRKCCSRYKSSDAINLQVSALPKCPDCGPVKQVHIHGQVCVCGFFDPFQSGCYKICSTWCYPICQSEMCKFLRNCIAPIVRARQQTLLGCLFGGGPPCVIACVEQYRPQVQLQVLDIVQFQSACTHTTQQVLCSQGYMFYMDLNQFLGLESQIRVLYWAPLDPARLRTPSS